MSFVAVFFFSSSLTILVPAFDCTVVTRKVKVSVFYLSTCKLLSFQVFLHMAKILRNTVSEHKQSYVINVSNEGQELLL